jgi:uroporphyrinogen decarboxylase
MTSREIVKRAIHFGRPPRLPVDMGSLGVSDFGGLPLRPPAGFVPACEGADEWGCVWARTEVKNMGQVKGHPLVDLRQLDRHPLPDYTDASRYLGVESALQGLEAQGRYVQCFVGQVLFERMWMLHGFENSLADLYVDRAGMEALADRIVDVHIRYVNEVARRFPGRIDGWSTTDDWGTQNAAYISFDLWMDFFFPRYKRIFDAMHAAGADVWVHSCGKVNEIVEGYIRAGVNVVNLQQPRALGITEIGQRYRGRIAFSSLADIQATLPTGDRRMIDQDAEQLMAHWASRQGGFVLSDYGDSEAIGVRDRFAKRHMYRQFSAWSQRLYGQPLPAYMEYIDEWQVVGPFRSPQPGRVDLDMPTPIEAAFAALGQGAVDVRAEYEQAGERFAWQPVLANADGIVNLDACLGRVEWACAYGCARIEWPRDEEVTFGFGSDDGIKVWLNGDVVHVNEVQRGCAGGADQVTLRLRKGVNRLLVKIDNYIAGWGFVVGFAQSKT